MSFPFKEFEPKWQQKWSEAKIFEAKVDRSKPKYYVLDMFPYPSGSGLHVGHIEGYTASDIVSRYKRARGFNVLHPMGWDAFGLPAEQHAIETGIHPEITTRKAADNFRRQLKMMGFSYDWSREIATCDASYYKWTQYIFTILFKRGLAYQREMPVNWCPALRTVLANEEVVDGKSERGGHPVERRMMKQWMLKITAYAEKLLEGLDRIDWSDRTKEGQRNWIGKSTGLQGHFAIKPFDDAQGRNHTETLEIFTTRPDTMFGVSFMVLSPEHPLVNKITTADQRSAVEEYQKRTSIKSELERQSSTEKTGVFTGAYAINPVNNQEIPIWIADYVLMGYGTGAIMAVPGHDERDFEFAKKFNLPILRVIEGGELPSADDGACVNSGFIDGMTKDAACAKVIAFFKEKKLGDAATLFKFRDWLFSRQRYWGEPFPVVHYPKSGTQTLPLSELPIALPTIEHYEPSENGEAPLSKADAAWLNFKNAQTDEVGKRETDTMPGSAGSSWYFLRYCDPKNDQTFCSREMEEYFMPVDLYFGGAEHTVGHLLYARFWQKVLFDEGLVTHDEPFKKLVHQGMILGEDGEKMSKSRGNTLSPDGVVDNYGADALRMYEMFMGPLERDKPWSQSGLGGVFKFLSKVWRLTHDEQGNLTIDDSEPTEDMLKLTHKTIKKVTLDIEALNFNTAISQMMIFVNEVSRQDKRPRAIIKSFIQCLAPFAPHIAEEIWHELGETDFVSIAPWPTYDEAYATSDTVTIAIQVNGKTRATFDFEVGVSQEVVFEKAKEVPFVIKQLQEKGTIRKVIFVKDRILNVII